MIKIETNMTRDDIFEVALYIYQNNLTEWGKEFFLLSLDQFRHNAVIYYRSITVKYDFNDASQISGIVKTTKAMGEAINICDAKYSHISKEQRSLDLSTVMYYFLQRHVLRAANDDEIWNQLLNQINQKGQNNGRKTT